MEQDTLQKWVCSWIWAGSVLPLQSCSDQPSLLWRGPCHQPWEPALGTPGQVESEPVRPVLGAPARLGAVCSRLSVAAVMRSLCPGRGVASSGKKRHVPTVTLSSLETKQWDQWDNVLGIVTVSVGEVLWVVTLTGSSFSRHLLTRSHLCPELPVSHSVMFYDKNPDLVPDIHEAAA